MIKEYVADICDILNINTPRISFDTSNFTTETMMAQCEDNGAVIYLRECSEPNPDQLFAIAHELRHIWQIQNNKSVYFCNYKPVNECVNIEEYNLQIAEVDANAFAGIIMINLFGLQPLFKGVSENVKQKIFAEMKQLNQLYELQ